MQANVLIADDHPLFRAAMRQALSEIVGNTILEAATFEEACAALHNNNDVELVFLDLNMPGNEGLTGLSEMRTQFPNVLVVIVSAQENPSLIRKAIELGASGYIPKSTALPDIAAAVNVVLDGEQWLPPSLSQTLGGQSLGDHRLGDHHDEEEKIFAEKISQLTPHQFKVLKMMADGLLNKQIAYELDISESTVKQHVSAVLRKMGVINRTKAGVLFKKMMSTDE